MEESYAIQVLCRMLKVSRSAYYEWQAKQQEVATNTNNKGEKEMETIIIDIFREHKRRYGVRRLVAELKGRGIAAGEYKVRKVLHQHGLKAIQPRRALYLVLLTAVTRIPLVQIYCWTKLVLLLLIGYG